MNEKKLQKLISELHNGNDRQRRAASYQLGKSKNPMAVPALIQAYNDLDSFVRRNAIYGLSTIGTQEAWDFLNSKKEELSENISIVIDGGLLKKTADGRITMGSDPTVMTWLAIIFWGALALGLLALVIKSFQKGSGFDADNLSLLVPTGLFGYLAYITYQQSRHGKIIIDPVSQKIKSRKREINFSDIETLVIHPTRLPLRGDMVKMTFLALVANENPMTLGSVSGGRYTTEQKSIQIMSLLAEKKFNADVEIRFPSSLMAYERKRPTQ